MVFSYNVIDDLFTLLSWWYLNWLLLLININAFVEFSFLCLWFDEWNATGVARLRGAAGCVWVLCCLKIKLARVTVGLLGWTFHVGLVALHAFHWLTLSIFCFVDEFLKIG